LLESYIPPSLRLSDEQLKCDVDKKSSQPSTDPQTPVKNHLQPEMSLLTPEDEKDLARELLADNFGRQFSVLDGLSDFLLSVYEKFGKRKWPIALSDVYLRLNKTFLTIFYDER
jgi:hypothetical protein